MGCLGNSKTEDQRNEEKAQREANKKIEKQLQKDKQVYRATHRLLLLGKGGAGGAGPGPAWRPGGAPAGRARRARPPPRARAPEPAARSRALSLGGEAGRGALGRRFGWAGAQKGAGGSGGAGTGPLPRLALSPSLSLFRPPPSLFFLLSFSARPTRRQGLGCLLGRGRGSPTGLRRLRQKEGFGDRKWGGGQREGDPPPWGV